MPYDPDRRHRCSIRLRGYDYAQAGAYFVTICTHERQALFDDPMPRQIAEQQWQALVRAGERGRISGRIALDAWVVMPDHVHGIILIEGGDGGYDEGRAQQPQDHYHWNDDRAAAPLQQRLQQGRGTADVDNDAPHGLGINVVPGSLGAIMRSYKATVARRIKALQHAYSTPVWQRGYYEHIIRDDKSLGRIRRYIATNPARLAEHCDNLAALLARMEMRA